MEQTPIHTLTDEALLDQLCDAEPGTVRHYDLAMEVAQRGLHNQAAVPSPYSGGTDQAPPPYSPPTELMQEARLLHIEAMHEAWAKDPERILFSAGQHRGELLVEVRRLQERNAMLGGALDDARRDVAELVASSTSREQQVRELQHLAADRGKRLHRALGDLAGMYNQYTPGEFGHDFMSAGEDAQDALEAEGLLDAQANAIYPDDDQAPQAIKDLLTTHGVAPQPPEVAAVLQKLFALVPDSDEARNMPHLLDVDLPAAFYEAAASLGIDLNTPTP
jgi:hypothetical protein